MRAEPAQGSRLAAGPARVRLVFSEPLEAGLARLSLVGPGGTTPLAAAPDPRDVYAVVAPLEDHVGPGVYRVAWRVVSADGHPVAGSVAFTVLGPAGAAQAVAAPGATAAADAASPADDPGAAAGWGPAAFGAPLVPALLRGLALGCLTALAGVLGFSVWPRGGEPPPGAGRLVAWLAVAAPLFILLHLAAWTVNASPDHQLAGGGAAAVLASDAGRVELWRAGLALLALWAVALARRPGLALGFAAGALVASGAAGHSAAIHPAVAVPSKALHLAGAAAWLGGLLWLLLALRAPPGAAARDPAATSAAAARVSAVALAAAGVVAVSGVVQTWLFLPSFASLAGSAYGRVALAKAGGLVGLVAFGAHHRARALPRLARAGGRAGPPGSLGTTLRAELALMAAVVLLGGLLAYVPTPAVPAVGVGTPPLASDR